MGFMKFYAKGSAAERELMALLNSNGFLTARIAGSGKNLNPDVLAFREGKQFAFECKNWNADHLRLEKDQFNGLVKWGEISGITTYVAWRQGKDSWLFIHPREMEVSEKGSSVTLRKAKLINRKIDELI